MWRWILFLILISAGIGALAFGVHIELEVQYEIGNWERTAKLLYSKDIDPYRETVAYCWISGPIALFLAYLVRPGFKKAIHATDEIT